MSVKKLRAEPPQAKPDRAYLIAEKYFEGREIDRCATAIRQREAELRTEMHRRLREQLDRIAGTRREDAYGIFHTIRRELDAEQKEGK